MEETGGASAYGVSLAGKGFDFNKFVRQPLTVVRVLSWVFAIVVFSCIESEGYINAPTSPQVKCIFNKNDSACHYAVGIGVIAFLACVGFLLLDVYLLFSSSAQERKLAVAADLGFSGLWTFLWFVCFCLLTSQWSRTEDMRGIPKDAGRAAIAFSFFSIATWGITTYFTLGRFRHGVDSLTIPTYTDPPPDQHTPYPPTYAPTTYTPYPSNVPDTLQHPSFSSTLPPQGDAGYQPPTY
ncbi:synaptogyrin-2 [Oryzias latipes]|uniref:Synaptogyrin n=1 Tax=Oryzias latipes TaxID=8090 RepID=H2MA35_ORYLA|nr:synaptogyrin-2 [Oryzias latipes]